MENISLYLLWKSAVSLHALYVTGQIYKYCLSMNIAEGTNQNSLLPFLQSVSSTKRFSCKIQSFKNNLTQKNTSNL